MSLPIRQKKIIYTYLHSSGNPDRKHLIVSTKADEGFTKENQYQNMETMAFPTWNIETNPSGIFTEHHETEGLYEAHNSVVRAFISQGYTKIKSKVLIIPEGCYTVKTYSKAA